MVAIDGILDTSRPRRQQFSLVSWIPREHIIQYIDVIMIKDTLPIKIVRF